MILLLFLLIFFTIFSSNESKFFDFQNTQKLTTILKDCLFEQGYKKNLFDWDILTTLFLVSNNFNKILTSSESFNTIKNDNFFLNYIVKYTIEMPRKFQSAKALSLEAPSLEAGFENKIPLSLSSPNNKKEIISRLNLINNINEFSYKVIGDNSNKTIGSVANIFEETNTLYREKKSFRTNIREHSDLFKEVLYDRIKYVRENRYPFTFLINNEKIFSYSASGPMYSDMYIKFCENSQERITPALNAENDMQAVYVKVDNVYVEGVHFEHDVYYIHNPKSDLLKNISAGVATYFTFWFNDIPSYEILEIIKDKKFNVVAFYTKILEKDVSSKFSNFIEYIHNNFYKSLIILLSSDDVLTEICKRSTSKEIAILRKCLRHIFFRKYIDGSISHLKPCVGHLLMPCYNRYSVLPINILLPSIKFIIEKTNLLQYGGSSNLIPFFLESYLTFPELYNKGIGNQITEIIILFKQKVINYRALLSDLDLFLEYNLNRVPKDFYIMIMNEVMHDLDRGSFFNILYEEIEKLEKDDEYFRNHYKLIIKIIKEMYEIIKNNKLNNNVLAVKQFMQIEQKQVHEKFDNNVTKICKFLFFLSICSLMKNNTFVRYYLQKFWLSFKKKIRDIIENSAEDHNITQIIEAERKRLKEERVKLRQNKNIT